MPLLRPPSSPAAPLGQTEFVAMMAVLFATIAFSIDSMLPALPGIAAELTPDAPNRAQLIIPVFVAGIGVGIFLAGPISDAVGRKPTVLGGLVLYLAGAILATQAPTLETLLAARFLQGLGVAAPRIVTIALIRDLYEGRAMARIMSFVMMVFVMIPAVAPAIGTLIIAGFGWRAIFWAFVVFGVAGGAWLHLRQPETLPPAQRRPLRWGPIRHALAEVAGNPMVRLCLAAMTLGYAQLFAVLVSIQPIMTEVFDLSDTAFPLWFLAIGVVSAGGTIVNATLVMRLGMRKLAMVAFGGMAVVALVTGGLVLSGLATGPLAFGLFVVLATAVFFIAGLTFGNLNALALQPLGHIAGLASSVIGAVSTILSVVIAAPVGLAYDGTIGPLVACVVLCSAASWALMRASREAAPVAG
ncbi:MAG: multidrug effflux MFS transporter [Rhodobacteraceae bacterium]|jgi:DHA1 family bicyclomycin/chloramphenicol resistance-like MFS transporter|nr:multidrug effflux MFS transporter [Paracoccaceae bacterium]